MNKGFQQLKLPAIVKTGEIYLLTHNLGKDELREPYPLYTIRSNKEVIAAMDMHVHLIHGDTYEFRKFLGVKEILQDTHVIKLLCYDKLYCVNTMIRFFLCRMLSFEEKLERARDIYEPDLDFDSWTPGDN
jgi:hypothetical protein